MNKKQEELAKRNAALDSVSVKLKFQREGIEIDFTEEERDALLDVFNWFKKSNFDCPKCGQLLNKEQEIDKNTDKQKKTFVCPWCSKESNIAELK